MNFSHYFIEYCQANVSGEFCGLPLDIAIMRDHAYLKQKIKSENEIRADQTRIIFEMLRSYSYEKAIESLNCDDFMDFLNAKAK